MKINFHRKELTDSGKRSILQFLNLFSCKCYMRDDEIERNVLVFMFGAHYSQSLPENVINCCPFGDPWAWTTATCAVTCCPLFVTCPGDVVKGSATIICESLESDDSKGTTSITLTLPDGAVCKIIFFLMMKWKKLIYFYFKSIDSLLDSNWHGGVQRASVVFAVYQLMYNLHYL